MTNWEIKPQRDGYAIWRNGEFMLWCYEMKWAEYRLAEMMDKEKENGTNS